jgi:hypothetical protein
MYQYKTRGRGSISKVEGHWPKGALLYMTKIKRFCIVHEPNENVWKYGVSITSEMAFTESLLLQKGHFLSSKEILLIPFIQEILFSFFKWGTLAQKKVTFSPLCMTSSRKEIRNCGIYNIIDNEDHPLFDLLPPIRYTRERGHNFILPLVRTERFKRAFINRSLFNFV